LRDITVVVDQTEQEDREDAAEATKHKVEPAVPVELLGQAYDETRDNRSTDQIADQEDLEDVWAAQRDHDNREDEQYNASSNDPDVELVAEEIVAAGADHG
jgi:hypothetical protein